MTAPVSSLADDQRWLAILDRDPQADTAFRYGVRTTGVYCRPSCASRLPRRENVRFFDTSELAEQHGFRACKRCRPRDLVIEQAPDDILHACRLIEQADGPVSLADLAREVGLSPFHLQRRFKAVVGISPHTYAVTCRARRLRDQIAAGPTITQAMLAAGFQSSSTFHGSARDHLGMTPTEYRNGAAGLAIRFTIVPCKLGWLMAAATERGLCLIALADTAEALRAEVIVRFPQADLQEEDAELAEQARQVVAAIDLPRAGQGLPLDIQGTVFQRKVWEALRAIPAGTTTTYAEIARRLGQPTAARAVAGACAANRLAILIPCHRVIRGDGDLGGYRWGIDRKRQLLEGEAGAGP